MSIVVGHPDCGKTGSWFVTRARKRSIGIKTKNARYRKPVSGVCVYHSVDQNLISRIPVVDVPAVLLVGQRYWSASD